MEVAEDAAGFVHVTGVGSSTALAQIVQLVQDAQTRQVPIQSLADAISSVFVPTVCALSLLTYMIWYALCSSGVVPEDWFAEEGAGTFSLMFAIACLVISCPCALGLATPTVSQSRKCHFQEVPVRRCLLCFFTTMTGTRMH